jgi:S-DNA-T family DNA segregation ATPase FtsK/SpoIIIE
MTNTRVNIFSETKEEKLFTILNSFGIKTDFISLKKDTYCDIYDLRLSPGVKTSKVDGVLLDIGMALSSASHPTGYPVIEQGIYRLEIQRERINSPQLSQALTKIPLGLYSPIAIGSDMRGSLLFSDLVEMPNLLVAGTTGSGKSMMLHSMIISLLRSKAQLFLADPKMVEFSKYESLKQVVDISNTPQETIAALDSLLSLMESRFNYLRKSGVRNVVEFNAKFKGKEVMNPVVMIIDEWADLVMQSKKIEDKLCLLTQKGRASGISVILATQRPSTKIISGTIKANFPARVAMKVVSSMDSRVILDETGAEKIAETGVGLFMDPYKSRPIMFKACMVNNVEQYFHGLERKSPPSIWKRLFA